MSIYLYNAYIFYALSFDSAELQQKSVDEFAEVYDSVLYRKVRELSIDENSKRTNSVWEVFTEFDGEKDFTKYGETGSLIASSIASYDKKQLLTLYKTLFTQQEKLSPLIDRLTKLYQWHLNNGNNTLISLYYCNLILQKLMLQTTEACLFEEISKLYEIIAASNSTDARLYAEITSNQLSLVFPCEDVDLNNRVFFDLFDLAKNNITSIDIAKNMLVSIIRLSDAPFILNSLHNIQRYIDDVLSITTDEEIQILAVTVVESIIEDSDVDYENLNLIIDYFEHLVGKLDLSNQEIEDTVTDVRSLINSVISNEGKSNSLPPKKTKLVDGFSATETSHQKNDDTKIRNAVATNVDDNEIRFATISEFIGSNKDNPFEKLRCIVVSESGNEQLSGVPMLVEKRSGATYVYVDDSDAHTLVLGATGSKKTRLLLMPTVLMLARAGESFVVSDPKGEIYKRTSNALRTYGYDVIVLNFRDTKKSDAWNPFTVPYNYYIKGDKLKAREYVTELAKTFFPYTLGDKTYWEDNARILFRALTLIMFLGKKSQVNAISLRKTFDELFKVTSYGAECRDKIFLNYLKLTYPDIYADISVVISEWSGAAQSIVSTFHMHMSIFQEDLVRNMMLDNGSESIFKRLSEGKVAVYLIMPDEKATYHMFVSVFTKQCYDELIAISLLNEDDKLENRVNFLLDEFAIIPCIPDFTTMMTASRSRNIRFTLVIQSLNQLEQKYGLDSSTITANCTNWIYLFSRESRLLDELASKCGIKADGKYLVQSASLQYLDQESSQALVLRRRVRPYKTTLMDINEYAQFFNMGMMPNKWRSANADIELKGFNYSDYLESVKKNEPETFSVISPETIKLSSLRMNTENDSETADEPTSYSTDLSDKNDKLIKIEEEMVSQIEQLTENLEVYRQHTIKLDKKLEKFEKHLSFSERVKELASNALWGSFYLISVFSIVYAIWQYFSS